MDFRSKILNSVKAGVRPCCAVFLAAAMVLGPMPPAWPESYKSIQERRPDLFHDQTGFRIARHRAPTPEDIPPPVEVVAADQAADLLAKGALAIDVSGALQSRYDELEGTWLVHGPRETLPGAVWLPEVGRGALEPDMSAYLAHNLEDLTQGDLGRPILVFCVADCWMSWNAAQRVAGLGYGHVFWFRNGTDGWLDSGRPLEPSLPVPVNVD